MKPNAQAIRDGESEDRNGEANAPERVGAAVYCDDRVSYVQMIGRMVRPEDEHEHETKTERD